MRKIRRRKILILDHERIIGPSLETLLESAGYEAKHFSDFSGISKIIIAEAPDLLITETAIKNGRKEFKKVKKLLAEFSMPIIYTCTKYRRNIAIEQELKIIGVFIKPFRNNALIRLINEYFDHLNRETTKKNYERYHIKS